jgi:glyoxylase-like metal-dependent hydrolase (beta-lactamase superfamily II)
VATQSAGVERPPPYFTPDREQALASIRRIAALEPEAMAPSHGQPVRGDALREGLRHLVEEYAEQKRGAGSRA